MNTEENTSKPPQGAPLVPPRHWLGMEELQATYWEDPAVRERRGQEFHDKPVETISMIDRLDTKGIVRRDFLTLMGASMALAGTACARRPVHKIIPYVVKPEEVTPGVANWYASTEPSTSLGVLVKTREGRPIKLEGNPDHPLSGGALSARVQASILDLYDTDRLKEPLLHVRGQAARKTLAWADADTQVVAKLKTARSVRVLTGNQLGPSARRLTREFLSAFPSGDHVEFEAFGLDEIADAQALSYGSAVVPRYRFDQAEVVLSLGADFLGGWLSPVEHSAGWARHRRLEGAQANACMSKVYCFETVMTITGASADERFPVRPGDELKIALAVAHELISVQKRSRFAEDLGIVAALGGYRPEAVAAEIGLPGGAGTIRRVAKDLWQARGMGLVVGGDVHAKSEDALALQIAINLLNSALGNEGTTVDGTVGHDLRPSGAYRGLEKLVADLKAGGVDALIIHGTNPAFTLPKDSGFAEAVAKAGFVVAIADREDETALLADVVLPATHFLEAWGDSGPRTGIFALQQPALAPLHASRSYEDCLLAWTRAGGLRVAGLAARVAADEGKNTWHDYLKASWQETVFKGHAAAGTLAVGSTGGFEPFWESSLRDGIYDARAAQGLTNANPTARPFRPASVNGLPRYQPSPEGTRLVLYAVPAMHDGRSANNPWLQEMPDPVSTATWDNFLNVSPQVAAQLKLKANDVVEVRSADGQSADLPVLVQPGLHPSVVAVAMGFGRRAAGRVGDGAGTDVQGFVRSVKGRLVFAGLPVTLRRTGEYYKLATTQWHNASENRPVINDISLAVFKKNPAEANHTDPHLRMDQVPTMWPKFEYKGHRWGMAIDLNACTGCGACVVGCQAENNVPVVGRDNVRVSREMHWIRIDRYYSGQPENPDVLFQPMLCQHCENAPCETVCPVIATNHSDEGLNEQTYNRCVGTRYCQNNCPYKVRRFNFFDHWKSYEGTMNLAWNPDVTVRTRGIMEKCTFCVQRIRDEKDVAKDRGEKVHDGQIKTACQQTCPTNAIVFGDINDPESKVSKLQADPRAFRALEVLNTVPAISYLAKVRNKEHVAGHGHDHGVGHDKGEA